MPSRDLLKAHVGHAQLVGERAQHAQLTGRRDPVAGAVLAHVAGRRLDRKWQRVRIGLERRLTAEENGDEGQAAKA